MSKNRHKRVNFVCRNFAVFFCFSPIFMWFWSIVIGLGFPQVSSLLLLLLLLTFVDLTDMLKPRPLVTSSDVNRSRKEWPGDVNADWGFPSKFPQTRLRDFVELISETKIRKQLKIKPWIQSLNFEIAFGLTTKYFEGVVLAVGGIFNIHEEQNYH